ncbi:anti-virulence regulator CigR family protein [Pseudomonas sp. KnCO4]|uniref:anti-virulence regulator CigR family protein n=1 Tax=Pseudomonas sp. KnCO4 TaxID=3381355 RepID=UPI003877AB6C
MAKRRWSVVAVVTSIALAVGPSLSYADPGNGKGQGHGKNQHVQGQHGQGQGQGQQGQGHGGGGGGYDHPSIDHGYVLDILAGHRSYWNAGPALPPGIQKNLARGKPLPPGIAKKLDGRLLGQLPHYDGYEWMQAGVDLILVAVATGIIYEVLHGALD